MLPLSTTDALVPAPAPEVPAPLPESGEAPSLGQGAAPSRGQGAAPSTGRGCAPSLAFLQRLIQERYPSARPNETPPLPSGIPAVDESLGGGLPGGAFCEIVAGGTSCGGQLLIAQWLTAIRQQRGYAALVDAGPNFDPCGLPPALLEHLLWVRCESPLHALQATDLLLRDENFPLLLLDLRGAPERALRRLKATLWYRLQRLAGHRSVWFAAFTPLALTPSCRVRLELIASLGLEALEEERSRLLEQLQTRVLRDHGQHLPEAAANAP